jgi:hypothetical protein
MTRKKKTNRHGRKTDRRRTALRPPNEVRNVQNRNKRKKKLSN